MKLNLSAITNLPGRGFCTSEIPSTSYEESPFDPCIELARDEFGYVSEGCWSDEGKLQLTRKGINKVRAHVHAAFVTFTRNKHPKETRHLTDASLWRFVDEELETEQATIDQATMAFLDKASKTLVMSLVRVTRNRANR